MYHLAFLYNDGLGVEKDPAMVAYYLYLAADRGFQPAIDTINKYKIPRPNNN
jgi:TPR repeat protein